MHMRYHAYFTGIFVHLVCVMLLICQQRFLFNVFLRFYFFHKKRVLTFLFLGSTFFTSMVIGLSLLHVFTNPVVRHDFGAPLKHTSGIDSWIPLHPDERERRCKLTLYPGWLQRVEVASVPVHRCTHVV